MRPPYANIRVVDRVQNRNVGHRFFVLFVKLYFTHRSSPRFRHINVYTHNAYNISVRHMCKVLFIREIAIYTHTATLKLPVERKNSIVSVYAPQRVINEKKKKKNFYNNIERDYNILYKLIRIYFNFAARNRIRTFIDGPFRRSSISERGTEHCNVCTGSSLSSAGYNNNNNIVHCSWRLRYCGTNDVYRYDAVITSRPSNALYDTNPFRYCDDFRTFSRNLDA